MSDFTEGPVEDQGIVIDRKDQEFVPFGICQNLTTWPCASLLSHNQTA